MKYEISTDYQDISSTMIYQNDAIPRVYQNDTSYTDKISPQYIKMYHAKRCTVVAMVYEKSVMIFDDISAIYELIELIDMIHLRLY